MGVLRWSYIVVDYIRDFKRIKEGDASPKSILENELLAEVLRRVMCVMKILYTEVLDAGILRTSFQLGIMAHDSSYMAPAVKARFYSSQRGQGVRGNGGETSKNNMPNRSASH